MGLGVIRCGACRRGAPSLRPAAGLKVEEAAQPSAWRGRALAAFVESKIGNFRGDPFREPGEGTQFSLGQAFERRGDRPMARSDDPQGGADRVSFVAWVGEGAGCQHSRARAS